MALYNVRVLQLHTPNDLRVELQRIGAEAASLRDHLAKGMFRAVKLERVPARLARFLYQELTLEGGDVVLPARSDERSAEVADVLLLGTHYQLQHLVVRIRTQSDDELTHLADELERALAQYDDAPRGALAIRGVRFAWGARTFIATEDTERVLADGADILAANDVSAVARLRVRTNAPIAMVAPDVQTARAALEAGADFVVITGAARDSHDLLADVIRDLRAQIERALDAGITAERILVGADVELLNRLGELRVLGHPILLDVSRVESAEEAAALVALGIARGADIVRVRDVQAMVHVARRLVRFQTTRGSPSRSCQPPDAGTYA